MDGSISQRDCASPAPRVYNQLVVVVVDVLPEFLQSVRNVRPRLPRALPKHTLAYSQSSTSISTMEETPSRDNVLLRRPAITTVVLLTALLVPVVAVPYALTRRHTSRLMKQIDYLVVANADLQKFVSKSAHDIALKREDLAHMTSLLEKSKSDISLLRRDMSQTQVQLNSFQSATRAELQTLFDEGKLTRQVLPAGASQCATYIRHLCLHPSGTVLIYFLGLAYH